MLVLELTADVLGLGRRGDRVVVDAASDWPQAVVHPQPFNPGRLLLHLAQGDLAPVTADAEEQLARWVSSADRQGRVGP